MRVGESRKDELIAQITARLKRVCVQMSDEAFAAMVEEMARLTMKYEGSATSTVAERARAMDAVRDRRPP